MGEAKRRGTFEQRKSAAIKRNAEIVRKQRLAEIAKRQAMTPEEREAKRRAGMFLATTYAFTGTNVLMPYKI